MTAADITYDSSLATNLNRTGSFVGGVQTNATKTGTNSADLLVDSPPAFSTIDKATGQYVLKTPNPWSGAYVNEDYDTVDTTGVPSNFYVKNVTGWNFHNTYFVTLKAVKLNSLGFDRANWTVAQSRSAHRSARASGAASQRRAAAQLAREGLPGDGGRPRHEGEELEENRPREGPGHRRALASLRSAAEAPER